MTKYNKLKDNTMEDEGRIKILDTTKGVLILSTLAYHLPQVAGTIYKVDTPILKLVIDSGVIFSSFFMPAFFIVSGYCSHFDYNLRTFVTKNFKYLIIQAFFLTILLRCFECINNGLCIYIDLIGEMKAILFFGTQWWFITTLFVAKFIYYVSRKIIHNFLGLFAVCVGLMILGVFLQPYLPMDYWYIRHALLLTIFVHIGYAFHQYNVFENKKLLWLGWTFPMTLIFLPTPLIPQITLSITNMSYVLIPLAILIPMSGVLFVVRFSSYIDCSFVDLLGRNTMPIYIFQICFMSFAERYIIRYIDIHTIWGMCVFS